MRAGIKIGAGGPRYKILHELGAGAFGRVYEIDIDGRKMALKREKILTRRPYVTKVYEWVKAAPEYFMQVHSYKVIKCKMTHEPPDFLKNRVLFDEEFQRNVRAHNESPYCLETIMELCGESLQTYLERDEITPAPMQEKRAVVAQLLHSVDWARANRLMIRDLHADNIMFCGGRIKHIDYGEFTHMDEPNPDIDAAEAAENWRVFSDLFSVIMIMFKPGITFKRYFSKLENWPNISLLVDHCKAAGAWPRVRELTAGIVGEEILEQWSPKWNNIGQYLDFIYAAVDEQANTAYWRGHIPDIKFPALFIPASDILFMIENYWDMPALIRHFED